MQSDESQEWVLIIAPVGRDATAMSALLSSNGFSARICETPGEECCQLIPNAAALLLTEEALELPQMPDLLKTLQAQPPWSELPLIILTSGGESRLARLLDMAASAAGSFTLLERPLGTATLLRSVDVARRARRRQYQVRDLLRQQAESEERYRSLVEQVKDYAIFRLDNAGRPVSWNEGVRRVLGFDEQSFLGSEASAIFTPEDVQAGVPQAELRQAVESGTAGDDRWLRRKDGRRFFATGVTTALWDESGRHIGFSKVLRDETPRKTIEEALAQAQAKLREHADNLEKQIAERTRDLQATNEQLEAFVYSIAHDLRAPLRSMVGYAELLLEEHSGGLPEVSRTFLRRIQASSEFMDRLLLDLLAYGRTARSDIALGEVEVRRAWDTALFQCATQIEQTSATIETAESLGRVRGHEPTLGQCLANLLSNALKFVAPGVQPRIRCWSEARGQCLRICVQDNGIGIPPSLQERAFRVFERLHGSRYSGTGIGLSIVRKGVERMGGDVGLDSQPGQGTTFWIELPKALPAPGSGP